MRRFVILSMGRSGSTLLCHGLSEHPQIHAYPEIFYDAEDQRISVNGEKYLDDRDPVDFCLTAVWNPANEFAKLCVGFKIFYFQCKENSQKHIWDYLKYNSDIRKIILIRENLFDAYMSELRARKSAIWHHHQSRMIDTERDLYNRPLDVDIGECARHMSANAAGIEWINSMFGAHAHRVTYEELERDFVSAVNGIASFLDCSAFKPTIGFEKLMTRSHAEGIANWSALKAHFAGTRFAPMLS